jgi:hypothetical protein
MTRAARLALRGELAQATAMHPLWFVVLPSVALVAMLECIAFARTGAWGSTLGRPWARRASVVIFSALIAIWIARALRLFGLTLDAVS